MIRLVSLNIEQSKHLGLVGEFIGHLQSDVLCAQELMEKDVPFIAQSFSSVSQVFAPMNYLHGEKSEGVFGTGIFSRLPIAASGARYYVGDPAQLPVEYVTDPRTFNNANRCISWNDIEKDGETFRIATTHFTWTPDGLPSEGQRRYMKAMLPVLADMGEFVLCGDFNAPRGGEIFAMLAEKYKDNVPPEYKTSIDVHLHRSGHVPSEKMDEKMVDGLFSTPEYIVSDVQLHSGVSDHMAITATIAKAASA